LGKRGPKKQPGQREKNGRLSRQPNIEAQRKLDGLDREQRDTLSVGLEGRERVWGVKPQHSRDQKAGSAIGRFCLQGQVTQAQYDAAMLFLESYQRNLRAIDAPPQPGAVDLNRTHGRPVGRENPAQLAQWRQEYRAACDAIQEKQNEIRLQGNLYGALYELLVRDTQLDYLLPNARTAMNALVKHYRLDGRIAA
jgi:hypothetical protein